ncbi:LysE family transporter [Candidatus Pelagibacter sp.]|nr:LysE family transporter [Candidatus Pelagibacter sp.]
MDFLALGFITGLSLILALGAQNIFVLEQGLKKQFIFLVCLICSISDYILIFLGIILFEYFQSYFNEIVELILNILLLIFLLYFIYSKIKLSFSNINFSTTKTEETFKSIFLKTLGFTYLNPHVYSDTVFFLGNFSKNFTLTNKIYFGLGASISSFLFFFTIGYLANFLSKYFNNKRTWFYINIFVILFMTVLSLYVLNNIINFY